LAPSSHFSSQSPPDAARYTQALFPMGSGASAGVTASIQASSQDDLKKLLDGLPAEARDKLKAALVADALKADAPKEAAKEEKPAAPAPAKPVESIFKFSSGLLDCCLSNPEIYKVVAEIPNARLVEMTCPPGGEDKPHDHPPHSLFFVKGGKLSITDYVDGKPGEPHEIEVPSGAPPIFSAGAHQVKNVGKEEVKALFVEPMPMCQPCGDVKDMITPFKAKPECYKILAENDDWITGMVNMDPGVADSIHQHRDHLIYVLEGDGVTLYPAEEGKDGNAVPIKPGMAIPAPIKGANGLFAKHIMKNTGSIPLKMVFFEMKR